MVSIRMVVSYDRYVELRQENVIESKEYYEQNMLLHEMELFNIVGIEGGRDVIVDYIHGLGQDDIRRYQYELLMVNSYDDIMGIYGSYTRQGGRVRRSQAGKTMVEYEYSDSSDITNVYTTNRYVNSIYKLLQLDGKYENIVHGYN